MSMTMCPSSAPAPIQPRCNLPPSTSPPPIPVPSVSITTSPEPPPAPWRASASTAQLPSLSTVTGSPSRSDMIAPNGHVRERQVGRVDRHARAPVQRHGDAEADRGDLLLDLGAGLLHRLDDRRHQPRLVEPERLAPDAVAHGEIGPDDAREELRAAEVDPDDAARSRRGRRHGGCHHTHRRWPTRSPTTRSTAAARGCCAGARTATAPRAGWPELPGRDAPPPDYEVQRSAPRLPQLPAALRRGGGRAPGTRRRITPGRVVKWLAIALVGWLALSAALFMVSAQIQRGDLAGEVGQQLDPGPYPLTGANTILVLGSDARTEGLAEPGSRRPEPLGLDHAAADRRRRQRLALDPARHRRRHPRPWHGQDQRRVRARRAGARDARPSRTTSASRSTTSSR